MIENTSKHLVKSYLAVLALTAALYIASCAPGTLWQDSGMFQYRIFHNDIEGKLGLALAHPLYCIIAIGVKYIPLGEFGYRINLISAIAAAFTVANVFLLLKLWLGGNGRSQRDNELDRTRGRCARGRGPYRGEACRRVEG